MRILVAESADFSPAAARILESAADVTWADVDSRSLADLLPGHDLLWVRLRSRIDKATLTAAPKLRAVATPTTGLTHIDLQAASEQGIAIISLRGEIEFLRTIRATAELTIGLMISLLRKLPAAMQHAIAEPWRRDLFRGQEMYGSTVGLVGFGRLGQLVARYLHAFDANVLACDPYVDRAEVPSYVRLCTLDQLLAESGLVSLHVNLTAETEGFFGASQFAAMRPGALLVNTARGELIEEPALLAALASGHLAGAALDVIGQEHALTPEHPLLGYARRNNNLLVTPHIGGCTGASMERTEVFLAGKVSRWIDEQRSAQ